MAEKYPSGNTPWSTAANWNGGTKPQPGDDVHANNFTVTIDEDVNVASLRTTAGTTAVAGGGFTTAVSRTVTADGAGIVAGTSTCLSFTGAAGQTLTGSGAVLGGAGVNTRGIVTTGTGVVNWTGDITGGSSGTGSGFRSQSTGAVSITGNVLGGTGPGVECTGATPVTITGNCTGGTGTAGFGYVAAATAATCTVNGNVVGSATQASVQGALVGSTGTLTVNGDVVPDVGNAVDVTATGKVILNGGIQSSATGVNWLGSDGARVVIKSTTTLTHAYRTDDGGAIGAERELATGGGGGGGRVCRLGL
jgi:hypothetical protein